MSNKHYVDNFSAPLLAELDRAKDALVEKLKSRLKDELEINEKMKTNQAKMEEQMKIEVKKNVAFEAEKRTWKELLASKEAIIKVLTEQMKGFLVEVVK